MGLKHRAVYCGLSVSLARDVLDRPHDRFLGLGERDREFPALADTFYQGVEFEPLILQGLHLRLLGIR